MTLGKMSEYCYAVSFMLRVKTYKPFMLSVITLNSVMLRVVLVEGMTVEGGKSKSGKFKRWEI
jgi:hypothetical protein